MTRTVPWTKTKNKREHRNGTRWMVGLLIKVPVRIKARTCDAPHDTLMLSTLYPTEPRTRSLCFNLSHINFVYLLIQLFIHIRPIRIHRSVQAFWKELIKPSSALIQSFLGFVQEQRLKNLICLLKLYRLCQTAFGVLINWCIEFNTSIVRSAIYTIQCPWRQEK